MSEEKPQQSPLPFDPSPSDLSEQDLLLGQVKQALRPLDPDPAEVREVLMSAYDLGYDPVRLYWKAVELRPKDYDPAPPLNEVLDEEVLSLLADEAESAGVESPESESE